MTGVQTCALPILLAYLQSLHPETPDINDNSQSNIDAVKAYLGKCRDDGDVKSMRSKDVMTAFRGQGDSVEVHPLSFHKYYGYVGVVDIFETDAEGKRRKVSCEIDFVVNKGVKKSYIQSALSLGNAQKEKKELRPLLGVKDLFRKIIVTKSGMKPWLDEAGILHLRLYEFLLNPAALDL